MDGDNLRYLELERIRKKHGGVLRPADVVKAAKAQTSPLHKYFTWDDTEAAHKQRLHEARALIRATVTVIPQHHEPIRAYSSLVPDRAEGDSYRATVDILNDEQRREILLNQALTEAKSWQRRYQSLADLQRVFDAITEVVESRSAIAAMT